jgi:hypothetical protein
MLSRGEQLLAGDVDGFVEEMRAYDALGVESVILTPADTSLTAWVKDAVAPAVPRLAELG